MHGARAKIVQSGKDLLYKAWHEMNPNTMSRTKEKCILMKSAEKAILQEIVGQAKSYSISSGADKGFRAGETQAKEQKNRESAEN